MYLVSSYVIGGIIYRQPFIIVSLDNGHLAVTVADQRLMLLLPVVIQSQIIRATCNWLLKQVNIKTSIKDLTERHK